MGRSGTRIGLGESAVAPGVEAAGAGLGMVKGRKGAGAEGVARG